MALFNAVTLVTLASLAPSVVAFIGPDCKNGPLANNTICDRNATVVDRAAALVGAMTVEEKIVNLVSKSPGVKRLGLPAYNWWGEALHGVAGAPGIDFEDEFSTATSYPMPLLMAASFDDELLYEIGVAIGTESRAFANGDKSPVDFWTPNVNAFKDPRWGRGSETPGEDVLRIKNYAKSMIAGLEGDNPKERRVVATCKHYAANDLEDWMGTSRHDFNAVISQQDLAEYYMAPFQQCARDSKVGSFMCSYNAVNGVPACANSWLLETVLRDHWKWATTNYITSDCEAVADISQNHKYAKTLAEGTALAFHAGMDLSCEYAGGSSDISGAYRQGLLNETTMDRALNRLFRGIILAGHFDGEDAVYAKLGAADVNTPRAQELSHKAATDGMVLLKNDGTLPLPLEEGSKVAMIGMWANASEKIKGGYSGPSPYERSPVYGAQQLGLSISFANGPLLQSSMANDTWSTAALAAANESDYILYFGGEDVSAAGETKDRMGVAWPGAQLDLIKKLSSLGKPMVIIQMGDMLDNTPILSNDGVNSYVWASWPGQDGGPAVMDILTGKRAIAGRLPLTQYPAKYTEFAMTDMNLRPGPSTVGNGTNPGRTYRWYPDAVQEFGFGLHYTTFNASFAVSETSFNIQELVAACDNEFQDTCAFPSLPVEVSNTGKRTSDYVALAFIKSENGPKPYPIKTLASYKRLHDIEAGTTGTASLDWTLGNVARVDETGSTVLYPGEYEVLLDVPTQATLKFTLTGEEEVLDKWPAPAS